MSNTLSPELLAQLFSQESEDPFLALVTLSHPSFSTVYLVNNVDNVVSRGQTYRAFPMRIVLPMDDGETSREISLDFDNVALDLIEEIRTVTTPIQVSLEFILSSLPDEVQYSFQELKIQTINYNKSRVSARLFLDSFLNTEITSEKYTPSVYPGIF